MADYIYKRKDGGTTECYGSVEEDSNFEIITRNEYDDGIVDDYDGRPTWFAVCKYFEAYAIKTDTIIEEIVAC